MSRAPRRSPACASGARVVLAGLATVLIVLLPVIMWSSSNTTPELVYQAAWLVMIGLAGVAVVVMAYTAVREWTQQRVI